MPENQRSNPSALTRSRIRFEIRVQRVESNVIIGIYSPQAKLAEFGLGVVEMQVKSRLHSFQKVVKSGFKAI